MSSDYWRQVHLGRVPAVAPVGDPVGHILDAMRAAGFEAGMCGEEMHVTRALKRVFVVRLDWRGAWDILTATVLGEHGAELLKLRETAPVVAKVLTTFAEARGAL